MEEEPLVLTMSRRALYGVSGLVTRIDLALLSLISDDGWFATRSAIAADVDSKEVQVGVVLMRRPPEGPQGLVGDGGILVRSAEVPAEVGRQLAALKGLARNLAASVVPGTTPGVELVGYLSDDTLPELRRVVVLVYRAVVPPATPAPPGSAWVSRGGLPDLLLDPVSRRAVGALG
jgi:hypothetical protein